VTEAWIDAAACDDIEDEDLIGVDIGGHAIAIYNLGGEFFATSAICTHEAEPLTDGLVIDGIIECPWHQGRFCVRTGRAKGAPATIDLKTYPVRVENGRILIDISKQQ